jgi:hypothetical protein
MTLFKVSFAAAFLSGLAAVSLAQAPQPVQPRMPVAVNVQSAQSSRYNVGEIVDYKSSGQWINCTVASPLEAGAYALRCGNSAEVRAKADSQQLRRHVAPANGMASYANDDDATSRMPVGRTVGARYGTREPRTCDHSKPALSAEAAKDLFICDAEREFGGSLYLVSDVELNAAAPRPFNPGIDKAKQGIDPRSSVVDIHATYNKYQCRVIPSDRDYPNVRNCDVFAMNNSNGGCFKNQSGEWHCLMYDFHPGATATATNVKPPTTELEPQ